MDTFLVQILKLVTYSMFSFKSFKIHRLQVTCILYILEPRQCKDNEFACKSSFDCIPKNKTCDGWNDCGDKSDESLDICQDKTSKLS